MNKIILVPDSFKGTMTSAEICQIMSSAIHAHLPAAQIISIPVADGGEGSVDCFISAVGGRRVAATVAGPYFKAVDSFYGLLPDGTAVVESAACAGLPLVGGSKSAVRTTTFGVGQLILHAAGQGAKKIIVGLGGTATNDGGAGAACALGVRFLDADGADFMPTGGLLHKISSIDMSGLSPTLHGVEITAMCDVDNPLCGPNGAAFVFGPQKGAAEEELPLLDSGLAHLAAVIRRDIGPDILCLPGAGAAGGMGGGMVAFLGARLQMGIEAVLDTVGFDSLVAGADLVITGEGRIDAQSLRGKVPVGVARRARAAGVPVIAIVGDIGSNVEAAYDMGITGIFSINRVAVPVSEARGRSREDLRLTVENLARCASVLRGK